MISKAVAAADGVPFFLEQLVISLIEEQSQGPAPHRRLGWRAADACPIDVGTSRSAARERGGSRRRRRASAAPSHGTFCSTLLNDDERGTGPGAAGGAGRGGDSACRGDTVRKFATSSGMPCCSGWRTNPCCTPSDGACTVASLEVLQEQERGEPTVLEALAYHLSEAGASAEAIGAWLRAGLSATKRSAHLEAIAHIRHGLGLLDQIPDPESRRQLELNLQASLMGSLLATQSATSSGAGRLLRPRASSCAKKAARRRSCSRSRSGSSPLSTAVVGAARRLRWRPSSSRAPSATDSSRSRSSGIACWGRRFSPRATLAAAKTALERSLALYIPERDATATHRYGQNTEVHTKSVLSLTQFCLGDVDAALEIGLDALQTADALRHPHSTAIPMAYVGGWVFGLCEATEQMMTEARNLLALAERHRLYGFRAQCGGFRRVGALPGRKSGTGHPDDCQGDRRIRFGPVPAGRSRSPGESGGRSASRRAAHRRGRDVRTCHAADARRQPMARTGSTSRAGGDRGRSRAD